MECGHARNFFVVYREAACRFSMSSGFTFNVVAWTDSLQSAHSVEFLLVLFFVIVQEWSRPCDNLSECVFQLMESRRTHVGSSRWIQVIWKCASTVTVENYIVD